MTDSERAIWKRHLFITALVGSVAVLLFHELVDGLGKGTFSWLPWRVEQAVVFVGLLAVPGALPGAMATGLVGMLFSFSPPMWLAVILMVVLNAAIYSGSWMAIRRGGPGAGLRRSAVLAPWVLYACFALWQASGNQS